MSFIKGLFKKKTDGVEVAFETFANFPLYLLLQEEPPFNDWRNPDTHVPTELEEYFKPCVWMYQMYVFYILTAVKYGYEIADRALRAQTEKLGSVLPEMARQLELSMKQIHRAVTTNTEEPEMMELEGEPIEIPVAYRLAVEFLVRGDDCPFPVSDEDWVAGVMPDLNDADFQLAACLEHGRETARECFETVVSSSKVVL